MLTSQFLVRSRPGEFFNFIEIGQGLCNNISGFGQINTNSNNNFSIFLSKEFINERK